MPGDVPGLGPELRELSALNEAMRALTSTLDLAAVLHAVLAGIKSFTAAEALSLLLYDADREELVFSATETLRENVLVTVEPPRLPIVGDVLADDRLVVVLRHATRLVGTLELTGGYGGRAFGESDRTRAAAVAAEVAAMLVAESTPHDSATLRAAFARIAAAVPSQTAELILYDPDRRALAFRASRTLEPGVVDGVRMRLDQGIAGWVARNRQSLRLDDASTDPRHDPSVASQTGLVPRSMLCVPVVHRGVLHGVIQVINKLDGAAFTDHELRVVQILADHAAIAIANATLYRQAEVASLTDDLTGLSNTRHFNRALPLLLAHGGSTSLLVLDLDHLKRLVDRHGHLVGSRTIADVGHVIGDQLRPGDFAARFGGDEFVVVLPATDTETARGIAEAVRAAIASRPLSDGIPPVTASVGIATFPDHAGDAESLFRAADAAMYDVKRTTKNAVGVARSVTAGPRAPG